MVSIKGRKWATFTTVSLCEQQEIIIETLQPVLYTCAFISQRRFCSGLDNAHERHKILPPYSCVLLWDGTGLILHQADQERSEQSSPDWQMKEELHWEEQGNISEPNALQGLFCTTCFLQRCGTFHALDLWSHLGCSYNSVSSLWPAIGGLFRAFYQIGMLSFLLLHNEKKSRKGKADIPEERTFFEQGPPHGDYSSFPWADSLRTHTGCSAPSPRGPGFPSTSWSCSFLGALATPGPQQKLLWRHL